MRAAQRALELQLAANSNDRVRLLQVCVLDHSSPEFEMPHLHVKCHFSDGTQAPWESIYFTNELGAHGLWGRRVAPACLHVGTVRWDTGE